MAAEDLLTNIETAFLAVFNANALLKEYNWQRWDSDAEVALPRAVMVMATRREPEDTPYHRVDITIAFSGRPKKQKLSVVVNELKDVLESITQAELDSASGDTVKFMGRALSVTQTRSIQEGLRVWTFGFVIYALPMV